MKEYKQYLSQGKLKQRGEGEGNEVQGMLPHLRFYQTPWNVSFSPLQVNPTFHYIFLTVYQQPLIFYISACIIPFSYYFGLFDGIPMYSISIDNWWNEIWTVFIMEYNRNQSYFFNAIK